MATFNYKQEYERYKRYYLSLTPILNKPENRAYTAIIFSFLTVSLFAWYAIRPTMQTIFTLKRQILDQTKLDKQMEDKISALIEAQAAMQDVSDTSVLNQALPTIPEPIEAIMQIQSLARSDNVKFMSVTVPPLPLSGRSGTKLASYTLSVSIAGTYPDIKNFLTGLTGLRRIITIDSVSFHPHLETIKIASGSAAPEKSATSMQIDLKLKVYYISS